MNRFSFQVRFLQIGSRYLRLMVSLRIHRRPIAIFAAALVTAVLLMINVVHVSKNRKLGPSISTTPSLLSWSLKSRFRSSGVHVNVADSPGEVMRLLFGAYRDQHPLDALEKMREALWRGRRQFMYKVEEDCNNFFLDDDDDAVLSLDKYTLDASVAAIGDRAESVVASRLNKSGVRVMFGGWHAPKGCKPRETIAIIVPYRDRFQNLLTFLNYMHRFLQKQRRHYVLVVAEQANFDVPFNRAKLFNAAVRELLETRPQIDCFVLHDVDKVPYHLNNLYSCGFQPHQLATMAWNRVNQTWSDYYPSFFGGVTAFSRWQLLRMNGVSNIFYGWGAEDDDMYGRSILAGYVPSYPSKYIGRMWVMGHHDDMKLIEERHEMLWSEYVSYRLIKDGLWQARYEVKRRSQRPLYTLLSFEV